MFGNYRLAAKLGEGGMGDVYFAEHQVIGRSAAIKVLHEMHTQSPEIVHRFVTEARAVSALRHPNIVDVTDFGQAAGRYYIVMEMLVGETLAERLWRRGPCTPAFAAQITRQVADALGRAHEQGIVHRDLKPENVFLLNLPDYPRDHIKVLDFGIAKLLGGRNECHTRAGTMLGTPYYMSPEQCLGDAGLDHRSDVYSLGVLLYEMLTGEIPFDGPVGQVIIAQVHTPPVPPIERNPEIPVALNDVVLKALHKDRAYRFQSMRDLKAALLRAAAQPPKPAPRPAAMPPPIRATARTGPPPVQERKTPHSNRMFRSLENMVAARIDEGRLPLPPLPRAAGRFFEVASVASANFDSMAAEIQRDRILAGEVLRMANRRYGARSGWMDKALRQIGVRHSKLIVLEIVTKKVYQSPHQRVRDLYPKLWKHAENIAFASRWLSQAAGGGDVEVDTAFMAGLLAMSGKPILGELLIQTESALRASASAGIPDEIWWYLDDRFSPAIAAQLARNWDLPREVVASLELLGDYDRGNPGCVANYVRAATAIVEEKEDVLAEGKALLGLRDALVDAVVEGLGGRRSQMNTRVTPVDSVPAERSPG